MELTRDTPCRVYGGVDLFIGAVRQAVRSKRLHDGFYGPPFVILYEER